MEEPANHSVSKEKLLASLYLIFLCYKEIAVPTPFRDIIQCCGIKCVNSCNIPYPEWALSGPFLNMHFFAHNFFSNPQTEFYFFLFTEKHGLFFELYQYTSLEPQSSLTSFSFLSPRR